MSSVKYCIIRLQSNARISEHVNIGIVAINSETQEIVVKAPDSYSNTKIKNWYPTLSVSIISKYVQLIKSRVKDQDIESIDQVVDLYATGIVHITSPMTVRVVRDFEHTVEKVYENSTDLRTIRPSGSLWTASKIKTSLRTKLDRKGLTGIKAEIDPDPVRTNLDDMPAYMHVRWLNGVNQYVRIFSLDKPDSSGEEAVRNAWDDAKAVVEDCEVILSNNSMASVILQRQESQVVGELSEVADVLQFKLEKMKIGVYNGHELDPLVKGKLLN